MMKKTMLAVLITLLLTLTLVLPVMAANQQMPTGSCPPGFELHDFAHHSGGDHDHHIGLAVDLNGDGLICMKPLKNGLHVHIDNVIR